MPGRRWSMARCSCNPAIRITGRLRRGTCFSPSRPNDTGGLRSPTRDNLRCIAAGQPKEIPMRRRFIALACVLAPFVLESEASAQQELTIPAGLPDWAFNIPDKVQPSAVKVEGIVKAPGSAKDYEWAKVAGNANPPDWFPDEHP